jgi:predicted GNAT superfamily acetyltransferase
LKERRKDYTEFAEGAEFPEKRKTQRERGRVEGKMSEGIKIRKCERLEEFHRCVEIEREVWGESDLETEPYVTFVLANQTGGHVLGAFDGELMVGFTMAVAGLRNGQAYLHSHMTGVIASHRNRGVGQMLKLYQREEALGRGLRRIEWTFDPLETRNAHFNFNRLGAIARKFITNFYGVTTSPLHRGLPTHRLLVEWELDSRRVVAAIQELTRDPVEAPAKIRLPAELEKWKKTSDARLGEVQARMREEFLGWFAKGYAVTGVRFAAGGVEYCLAPWSDF